MHCGSDTDLIKGAGIKGSSSWSRSGPDLNLLEEEITLGGWVGAEPPQVSSGHLRAGARSSFGSSTLMPGPDVSRAN